MSKVTVFLLNAGKKVEVDFGDLKNLLHQRIISGEDYLKAVKADAEKALPGWEAKAAQDVAEAEAAAKAVDAAVKADAVKAEKDVEAVIKAAENDAEALGRTKSKDVAPKSNKPTDAVTEPPEATPDNKKDGA